jgi:micrococcal nuclease
MIEAVVIVLLLSAVVVLYLGALLKKSSFFDFVALALCLAVLLVVTSANASWGPYLDLRGVRIIDGDTLEAQVEVYDNVWINRSFRLRGVNTPEKTSNQTCERKLAEAATLFVADTLRKSKKLILLNVAEDKYAGRADATVLVDGVDLAALIIAAGHGKPYAGGKRTAWCSDNLK